MVTFLTIPLSAPLQPACITEIISLFGSNKTIDLINYLKKNDKTNIYFIMGADNLINFHKWYKSKEISKKWQSQKLFKPKLHKKEVKYLYQGWLKAVNKIIVKKNRK